MSCETRNARHFFLPLLQVRGWDEGYYYQPFDDDWQITDDCSCLIPGRSPLDECTSVTYGTQADAGCWVEGDSATIYAFPAEKCARAI